MADPVNEQIMAALLAKLRKVPGIGARVYDGYLDVSEIEGSPALCVYATDEEAVNQGVESTRRKLWDMTVGIVGYVKGEGSAAKARDLAREAESALEADPTLGVGNVEQCRVMRRTIANVISKDPQFGFQGMIDLVALVRYRYEIGSP